MKRIDKRRMEEFSEEDDAKESFTRKLEESRLRWPGYIERMEGA